MIANNNTATNSVNSYNINIQPGAVERAWD